MPEADDLGSDVYYYRMNRRKSQRDMIQRKNTSSRQKEAVVGETIRMGGDYYAYGV
jgi:hypothetical protein